MSEEWGNESPCVLGLNQCFSDLNVPVTLLGILLKGRWCFSRCVCVWRGGGRTKVLCLSQAPRWCWCCWYRLHALKSWGLNPSPWINVGAIQPATCHEDRQLSSSVVGAGSRVFQEAFLHLPGGKPFLPDGGCGYSPASLFEEPRGRVARTWDGRDVKPCPRWVLWPADSSLHLENASSSGGCPQPSWCSYSAPRAPSVCPYPPPRIQRLSLQDWLRLSSKIFVNEPKHLYGRKKSNP